MPIFEESLHVWMPGDKVQFVERWCLVTLQDFYYYTRYDNRIEGRKPLFEIGLADIEYVHRAKINIVELHGHQINKGVGSFHFEIVIKPDLAPPQEDSKNLDT